MNPKILAFFFVLPTLLECLAYPTPSSAAWSNDALLFAVADEDDEEEDDDDVGSSSDHSQASSSLYSHYSSVTAQRLVTRKKSTKKRKIHHRDSTTHSRRNVRKPKSVTKHGYASISDSAKKVSPAKKRPHVQHQIKQTRLGSARSNSRRSTATHLTQSKQASSPTNRLHENKKPVRGSKSLHRPFPAKTPADSKRIRTGQSATRTHQSARKTKSETQTQQTRIERKRTKGSGMNERTSQPPNLSHRTSAKANRDRARREATKLLSRKAYPNSPKRVTNPEKAQRRSNRSKD